MHPKVRLRTQVGRVAACLALLNLAVPGGALVTFGVPLRESVEESLAAKTARERELAKRRKKSASRMLTAKEERSLQGRAGENPYVAGQSKWDVVYKGVNLVTGNFSTSATDMSFDGGYGIPVNVTRSYSANDPDEGPFGKGWTLSADVRSTAGGVLKSGGAPNRAIPTTLKERPMSQDDPNLPIEPAEAVSAVDAGGHEETVQKDVDGLLMPPPWDRNEYDSVYEWVTLNGQKFRVLLSNTLRTVDGTVYTYAKQGSYPLGTRPWNNQSASPEAANVLKVTSATDRQGNVTTYAYGSGWVSLDKANGTTQEHPLTSVSMPGGHVITLTWGTNSSLSSYNRVTAVSDNSSPARVLSYGYTGAPGDGLLWTVTSPGGKTTTYGYGTASAYDNRWSANFNEPAVTVQATGLLTSITDPRGMTSQIQYGMDNAYVGAYMGWGGACVAVKSVVAPNGMATYFNLGPNPNVANAGAYRCQVDEWAGPSTTMANLYNRFWFRAIPVSWNSGSVPIFRTGVDSWANGIADMDLAGQQGPFWGKTYSAQDQNLLECVQYAKSAAYVHPNYDGTSLASQRKLAVANSSLYATTTTTAAYNFMGNPLSTTTVESVQNWYGLTPPANRTATVQYAYWGSDKYYHQKAVKDQAGRYSFTDYYPSTAAAGKRGQTYRVYDPKNGGIVDTADANYPVPYYAPSGSEWRFQVRPANAANCSAQFDYDAQGRPTDVWKLQKTTTSPWSYVQTRTTYGGDGAPTWGQASVVVEDYGTGKINRTTQTLAYTSYGKASKVQDAKGQVFETVFDGDGLVQSVTRTDTSTPQTLVSYSYGTSGVSNGQPTSVTDGLSGVVQTISYAASGGGKGQPASVTETNGTDSYTTSYTYNLAGERETATYATPSGTQRWGYLDYMRFGNPDQSSRAFQTLTRLDASGNPTGEEIHYAYDSLGRLQASAFAQTPALVSGGTYVPSAGSRYYDRSHPASRRARAFYLYDAGGRLRSVEHYWDVWNGSAYTSDAVLANQCDYELSGSNRGLKTASRFYKQNPSNVNAFLLERTETYGYDAHLDYLTSANYGDGLPSATPTWSYDAAGNRNDASVVDNLNRATTLGGVSVTNDVLGNRLTKSGTTYAWDVLNRLTSLSGSVAASYGYRADGMRVAKVTGGTTARYRHDGQMGIEDVETSSTATTVTRYGLGARGVDLIERTNASGTVTGFPVYDAHGNNVGTLSRSGTGWSLNDRRSYDAWGQVRAQQSAGDPKLRYCASLGHKQDDESGLIYMRARYYEPSSGRFVNEDAAREGLNWLTYCSNNPVFFVDPNGQTPKQMAQVLSSQACFMAAFFMLGSSSPSGWKTGGAVALIVAGVYLAACASDGDPTRMYDGGGPMGEGAVGGTKGWLIATTLTLAVGYITALCQEEIPRMTKANAILHTMSAELFAHNIVLFFYIAAIDEGSAEPW